LAKHPVLRVLPLATLVLTAISLGGCGRSHFSSLDLSARRPLTERECLARAMYFESNRSSEDGMLAVGTVVMNRLEDRRYPKTVCGVVGQPGQFAEGALTKPVSPRLMARVERVADDVLAGKRHAGLAEAKHFHTAGYTFPYRNMHYVLLAGGNVFYEKRTPGTFKPIAPSELGAPTTMLASNEKRRPTMMAAVAPASEPRTTKSAATLVAKTAPPAAFKPQPVQVAAAQPKPKPIVLAMLSEKARPLPPPRSIADLIATEDRRR
jgi:spore germination cell wall hydrolase CwlJ-like protein